MHYSTIAFSPTQGVFLPVPDDDVAAAGHLAELLDTCAATCAEVAAGAPGERALLTACAATCRSTARVLALGVPCRSLCQGCAELCLACADALGPGSPLARLCRDCAAACRDLA